MGVSLNCETSIRLFWPRTLDQIGGITYLGRADVSNGRGSGCAPALRVPSKRNRVRGKPPFRGGPRYGVSIRQGARVGARSAGLLGRPGPSPVLGRDGLPRLLLPARGRAQ